jgi:hypothetical protein
MKRIAVMLLLLAGCASQPQGVPEIDESGAIDDFVAINELDEVDVVRAMNGFDYDYLTDRYVVVRTRGAWYLAQMFGRCPELTNMNEDVQPDFRYDARAIRSGVDTIRGCRIKNIYEIDETQAQELEQIGEAPGERRTTTG